jgi:hypothetical protein
MMNSVVAWCVQNVFQGSQFIHSSSMYPELVHSVELLVRIEHGRRNEEGHRNVEQPAEVYLENRLSKSCRKILCVF